MTLPLTIKNSTREEFTLKLVTRGWLSTFIIGVKRLKPRQLCALPSDSPVFVHARSLVNPVAHCRSRKGDKPVDWIPVGPDVFGLPQNFYR